MFVLIGKFLLTAWFSWRFLDNFYQGEVLGAFHGSSMEAMVVGHILTLGFLVFAVGFWHMTTTSLKSYFQARRVGNLSTSSL